MDVTLNIAHVLVGCTEKPHIIPKTKYFVSNFYDNTFEQLKNQLLVNSKKFLTPKQIDL